MGDVKEPSSLCLTVYGFELRTFQPSQTPQATRLRCPAYLVYSLKVSIEMWYLMLGISVSASLSTNVLLYHVISAISSTTLAVVVLRGKIKHCRKQAVAWQKSQAILFNYLGGLQCFSLQFCPVNAV